jgi:hypothetical protein
VSFDDFIGGMRNTEIAKALDLIAPRLDSELAKAIMREAARRLRGEPEPHYAGPPLPDLPPLEAHATPDPDATPLGIMMDRIVRQAIEMVYQ